MTEISFEEFQLENMGHADKYISVRELNEKIHMENENKKIKWIYTEKDWERKSEKWIIGHVWDRAKGRFVSLGSLTREMNKKRKLKQKKE